MQTKCAHAAAGIDTEMRDYDQMDELAMQLLTCVSVLCCAAD